MAGAITPAPHERGWWRVLLALVLFLLVPAIPLLRAVAPIDAPLLLLTPALAACAALGAAFGGRVLLAVSWVALAGWSLAMPVEGSAMYGSLARGWALLLAGAFGLVSLLATQQRFFVRALTATAVALVAALALVTATPRVQADRVARAVHQELARRVDSSLAELHAVAGTREWQEFSRRNTGAAALLDNGEEQLRAMPAVATAVFPALLALESLAALGLAWSLYHRFSRVRLGPPLAPLREFRFSDQLIWALVVGITTLVVPTLDAFRGAGLNLVAFFGALYVIRGLGVLIWLLAPGRLMLALLVSLALLAAPLLGLFALGLGLGDTWLDWRSRARATR